MIPLAERLEIVSHISYVDQAVAEVVPDKLETWKIARGSTSCSRATTGAAPPRARSWRRDFAAVGVEIVYFPYTMHTSSTLLRRVLAGIDGERERSTATG